jgi:N-methylhydantoinase A/oxoprolinase/acetone carboxylase beta subunit
VVSIERGRDPRDLTFVAFGGSGPVHGCRIAQALGIPRIVLPASAGVTAAIGLLAAEVKFDVARTHVRRLDAVDGAALDAMYGEMGAQAIAVVQESAVAGDVVVTRSADARYVGQGYEVTVPVPQGRLDRRRSSACARAFTRSTPLATATRTRPSRSRWSPGSSRRSAAPADRARQGRRDLGGRAPQVDAPRVFPQARGYGPRRCTTATGLPAGTSLTGPAIVEERESTTVLPPGVTRRWTSTPA